METRRIPPPWSVERQGVSNRQMSLLQFRGAFTGQLEVEEAPPEVETLIKTARQGRHGHRDATLILVAYRHGLRAAEMCDLEWSQVEFDRAATLHVRRAKNGKPAAHPIRGDELRGLR
jgi:integrase